MEGPVDFEEYHGAARGAWRSLARTNERASLAVCRRATADPDILARLMMYACGIGWDWIGLCRVPELVCVRESEGQPDHDLVSLAPALATLRPLNKIPASTLIITLFFLATVAHWSRRMFDRERASSIDCSDGASSSIDAERASRSTSDSARRQLRGTIVAATCTANVGSRMSSSSMRRVELEALGHRAPLRSRVVAVECAIDTSSTRRELRRVAARRRWPGRLGHAVADAPEIDL